MRLESTDLKNAIDGALNKTIESGERAEIWKRFLGRIEYPQQNQPKVHS